MDNINHERLPYIIKRNFAKFEDLSEEVSPESVEIPIIPSNEELNPEIWENYKLKPKIRLFLLKIAREFYDFLKIDIPIKDIVFTGSMANFNWTPTSDVDLHLLLDLEASGEPKEFLEEYLIAKKTIWNDIHNITIKNFEVELYAKDEESVLSSKGIYSVVKNKWLQKPTKNTGKIDTVAIKEKAAHLMSDIDELNLISSNKARLERANRIAKRIKLLRQAGLSQKGEFSNENLAFKALRRNGYLAKLYDHKQNSFDSMLSIDEELQESKKTSKQLITEGENRKYEYGCLMLEFGNIKNWNELTSIISPEDIYDTEGHGLETDPHVTVLFGLHGDEVDTNAVKGIIKEDLHETEIITATLNEISCFENAEYDVLKFDVGSDLLHQLNTKLRNLPHTNNFPDYHPHMTIAYLKPGKGKKYCRKLKNPIQVASSNFKYSYPPDNKDMFDVNSLKKPQSTLGVEKDIEGMTPEKIEIIKKFINFTINKLGLEEPVSVYLHKGRDEYIVTTASYVPSDNTNHIRVEGRALVDILKSIGHELTHNRQREIGSFNPGEAVQNIGGWIEDEANAKAGVLIKDFAMNYGNDAIYDM